MSNSLRFLLEMNIISPRHLLQGYLEVRRVVLPSPPHPLVVLHLAEVRLSHGGSGPGPGSLEDTVLIVLLSTGNALVAGLRQRSKIYGPASLPPLVLAAGARGPGGPSPRARRGSSSVVWLTASFPLTNPPTLFWVHYSAYFSSTYRRYLDRPTYGTEYQ